MQIFSLTDSNTCNLMSLCILASKQVNEYWKFKTTYEIQNKNIKFYKADALLIENISTQNKNTIVHTVYSNPYKHFYFSFQIFI